MLHLNAKQRVKLFNDEKHLGVTYKLIMQHGWSNDNFAICLYECHGKV